MRTKYRDWPPERRFPSLDAEWFRKIHAPAGAIAKWADFFDEGHDDSALFRHVLACCSGKAPATVAAWLRWKRDPDAYDDQHIGEETKERLARIAAALNWSPPPPLKIWKSLSRRIVLFTDLSSVANPRFHLEVLESILMAAGSSDTKSYVAVQSIRPREPGNTQVVGQALVRIDPDAAIWFRLTPSRAELEVIRRHPKIVPVVVIHGDRLQYPDPVVSHVVPVHDHVAAAVESWARRVFPAWNTGAKVAIGAMPPDTQVPEYPPVANQVRASLRQERVEKVTEGLYKAGLEPVLHYVPNYTAGEAYDFLQRYRDAAGFVCLSDELAVAVNQLLLASDRERPRPILGFDGSDLARRHGIESLNQHVPQIGTRAVRAVASAVKYLRENDGRLPGFHEAGIPVELAQWAGQLPRGE